MSIGSRLGVLGVGALIGGGGLVLMALPVSESYANDAFGITGGDVDVKCGNGFARSVEVDFEDEQEQMAYDIDSTFGEPPIFEGQTASTVCDDGLKTARTTGIAAMVIGGLVFVFGMVRAGRSPLVQVPASGYQGAVPPQPQPRPPQPQPPQPRSPAPPAPSVAVAPPSQHAPGYRPYSPAAPRVPAPAVLAPSPETAAGSEPLPVVEHTIMRSRDAPSSVPGIAVATLGDGRRIELERSVVIGRQPVVPGHLTGAVTVAVADLAVSKTHLAIGTHHGDQIWVEDLDSSNGTELVAADEAVRIVASGVRVLIERGETIRFGDQCITLEFPVPS